MRITKVDIPADGSDGMQHIKMEKMGEVVLLAGKNGAGKTRVMNKISDYLKLKPLAHTIKSNTERVNEAKQQILEIEKEIPEKESLIDSMRKGSMNPSYEQQNLDRLKQQLKYLKIEIEQKKLDNSWIHIETSELSDRYEIVNFVPKSTNLNDYKELTVKALEKYKAFASKIGMENLHVACLPHIVTIQQHKFNVTHPDNIIGEGDKEKALEEYEKLNTLIDKILGLSIEREKTIKGDTTINGLPLHNNNFSDGQKILLQFCVALHAQGASLDNLILFMDEPENHLHPSVIIEVIDKIKECMPNGQIWIATHSIPLLARFDPSSIFFVEDGNVRHAGKIPEKVLGSLLGNDENISKLQDFIGLPAQLATSRYAFECLLEPAVVETASTDPQSRQIRNELLSLSSSGVIRILDFGAGKGRVISNIAEQDQEEEQKDKLVSKIEYVAYDLFDTYKDLCEASIDTAYSNHEKRYYNDIDKLKVDHNKNSFEVIIMCNVLHEIPPKDWLKLFCKGGDIGDLLSDKGVLLIVEDHQIPIGEKAHANGFLVLDTLQLKELFLITSNQDIKVTEEKEGRLKVHQISKKVLTNITKESRCSALNELKKTAKKKILDIREKGTSYKEGQLHGFWTQQFANAELALEELCGVS